MSPFNQNYEMKLVSGSKVSVEPCKHCILVAVPHVYIVLSE